MTTQVMKTGIAGLALAILVAVSQPSQAFWFWKKKDTYTETQYPIVLVHGMLGFDAVLGVDYWYRITGELTRSGAEVYVAQVTALDSSEARGLELIAQLENLKAITGADGFNLIGHSHGGPTSRVAASLRPDLVKSVTSVGSPHKGSPVADVVLGVSESPVAETVVTGVLNGLGTLINGLSSNPTDNGQDAMASLQALSPAGSAAFNQQYPEAIPADCGEGDYAVNGIRYYSWSGTEPFTNPLDVTDYALTLVALAFDEPNDGLVGRCSSHMGMVIRDDYKMNHLDEVNQVLGIHSLLDTDPVTVYRQHANRLKNAGL
ncbi:lipase family alpha/beta hydrolase [Kistimonas asteriae]|uniref:lipase family alpha/beta hydrolase n=1 Tax=Kistimonas asteriae TaxID=517724 RepID=UPI001FE80424|nr:triacylglycerol lipase [Kistimonas asteriae]